MNKRLLFKCFISFAFLLFFTILLPLTDFNTVSVKAASIDPEKNGDYRLNLKSITLVKGKIHQLKVYNLSESAKLFFKSDDEEIASVSEDGTITANKVGDTVVTVTIKDEANVTTLECKVTVGLPAFSVKLTRSRIILGVDKTDFLNAILKPSNTFEDARFSSNDSSIASVSIGGRVTAKKVGLTYAFAEIDVLNADGSRRYSRCTVIVTSSDDASLVENYFSNHLELDLIAEDDLNKALDEFFNTKYDPASATSVDKSLNRFLDDKFDLAKLSAQRDADIAKMQ